MTNNPNYETDYVIVNSTRGGGYDGPHWEIKKKDGDNYRFVNGETYKTPKEAQLALRVLKGLQDGEN